MIRRTAIALAATAAATLLAPAAPAAAVGAGSTTGGFVTGEDGWLEAACAFHRTGPTTAKVVGAAESPLAHHVTLTCSVGGVSVWGYGGPVAVVDEVVSIPAGDVALCVHAFAQWTIDRQEEVSTTCV